MLQFFVTLAVPGQFVFMPITYGSLPFDIVFFCAGVVAKYNDWLAGGLSRMSMCNVVCIRLLAVLCVLGWFAVFSALYVADFGVFMPKKDASDRDCDDDDAEWSDYALAAYGASFVLAGVCCCVMSVALVQFAHAHCNFRTRLSRKLSQAAYTVYIVHPLVVVPVTWSYKALLEEVGGESLYFCPDTSVSKTRLTHDGLVWLGFAYTSILSLLILWPSAHFIRKLPGLNQIL